MRGLRCKHRHGGRARGACVPGAELIEQRGEDVCQVALKAQLGPPWKRFLGTITVVRRDSGGHRIVMTNRARDAKGNRVGDATIEIGLAQLGNHTNVSIYSRVTIVHAMLAEKTIIQTSAKQMAQFTANLQAMIAETPRP